MYISLSAPRVGTGILLVLLSTAHPAHGPAHGMFFLLFLNLVSHRLLTIPSPVVIKVSRELVSSSHRWTIIPGKRAFMNLCVLILTPQWPAWHRAQNTCSIKACQCRPLIKLGEPKTSVFKPSPLPSLLHHQQDSTVTIPSTEWFLSHF